METENFAALDIQKEYHRTLHASRFAATAMLLLSAAWSGMQCAGASRSAEIFENMVTGGMKAMPALTQAVINHQTEFLALSSLPAFVAVMYIWIAGRNPARVILAATAGVVICLLTGLVVHHALTGALQTIITQFNG